MSGTEQNNDLEGNKMEIKELVTKAHDNAVNKGFWEDIEDLKGLQEFFKNPVTNLISEEINAIGNRLMLIVGEVAEAQEGLRKDNRENFKEELADIVIRVADLAGGLNVDLDSEIQRKMEINRTRTYKHGKQF